jgi:hypothetical protein
MLINVKETLFFSAPKILSGGEVRLSTSSKMYIFLCAGTQQRPSTPTPVTSTMLGRLLLQKVITRGTPKLYMTEGVSNATSGT